MWYSWTCPVDLHHHVWHPFDWFIQRKIAYYLHDISSFIFIFCIPDCFGNGKKCHLLFHKNVTCWLFCIDYRDREWVSRFGEWEQMDMRDCFVMIRVLWNWIVVMLAQVIKKSWVSSLRVGKIHNMKINLSKTVLKKLCLRHFENCRHGWMLLESKVRLLKNFPLQWIFINYWGTFQLLKSICQAPFWDSHCASNYGHPMSKTTQFFLHRA